MGSVSKGKGIPPSHVYPYIADHPSACLEGGLRKMKIRLFGCRVDLHKMTDKDELGCYHTHPAYAIRIILWGGYSELVYGQTVEKKWRPGMIGLIRPKLCHRISRLDNGRSSYSLCLRGPITAPIHLVGFGWSLKERMFRSEPNG